MEDFMDTVGLAQRLCVSPDTVRYWRRVGTGPAYTRIGNRVRYTEADVQAWLASRRVAA